MGTTMRVIPLTSRLPRAPGRSRKPSSSLSSGRPPQHVNETVTMSESDLFDMLQRASENGADLALERIGLGDDKAAADVHDLRTLIDGWRSTKKSVYDQIIKWAIGLVLAAIGTALWLKYGTKP